MLSFGFQNRNYMWGKIFFIYLCALSVISLVSDTFYNGEAFILIFILLRIILIEQFNFKTKNISLNKMIFS
jgi:hypothetical protein